ncbi:MAG: TIGR02391 family protein [Candidatus Dadabacteria bacterium]|nr:TIGR02391 family protein [Candidatus Dadabacteria bacterium]
MPRRKKLKMTFEPDTIEHLGVRMYSTLPPILAELIANAHDADAEHVLLTLNDSEKNKEIIVEDDGAGMSFDEINEKFLRIGRNRREHDETDFTPRLGRKIIGKKGLGKLSFFGIAHEIEISTRKNAKENIFRMNWEDIKKEEKEYEPRILKRDRSCPHGEHGTKIILRKIRRKSDFSAEDLANSLSKMFILEPDFEIEIRRNSEDPIIVSNEKKYEDLKKQVEWKIPDDYKDEGDYEKAGEIKGHLMATEKPIPPKTNMRGITLFSRKKMVNRPEYFSNSTSSHFFSYLTGWLEVDFIDEFPDDVIATNRQSLNWEHEETRKLRVHLRKLIRWLERDWREKRRKKRNKRLKEKTGINIPEWFDKLPDDIRRKITPVVENILGDDSELAGDVQVEVVEKLHQIVPEYPRYHWRHLHPKIKEASETDYQNEDYYRAFQEAVKRYVAEVRKKSRSKNSSEASMMGEVFGKGNKGPTALRVAEDFKKPGGGDFQVQTIENIEDGQKHLSMGVISGCRNPVNHEEVADLRDSGLFTEKDCLDALSLLSHLFSRLADSRKS